MTKDAFIWEPRGRDPKLKKELKGKIHGDKAEAKKKIYGNVEEGI